ncbi:hypothetical protein [Janthinobacterium fluminis]|uniref:Uncharacterized protein n=1 Tax=Janthinobacterium fluminis TaxID=2987524 RepID=A0ABT5JYY9_9BURK|nr:hypothetical protein [Janthinobacterium fluminis]MDC8757378.1 hypothetical protein [Janthinobacterium fluminis]
MTVSTISSNKAAVQIAPQKPPETTQQVKPPPPPPPPREVAPTSTVNTNGQTTGTTISTTA